MKHPWTNVYGVARSLMAAGLLSTLLFNGIDVLFQPAAFRALHEAVVIHKIGLFYLFSGSPQSLEAARWIAIGLLVVVASGWRPRVTGVLHWWLSFSFSVATTVAEGGDQINAILTLLLIPVTLTDPRRWHWTAWTTGAARLREQARVIIAASCFTVIRLQVAVIYFHAGTSKLTVPEWMDGTAVYYWYTHPVYGMNDTVRSLAMPLLTNALGVTVLTWGAIFLEIALASALVMDRRHFPVLLKLGIVFHFGIVLAHGLFSFFLAMAAALVLYLRPADEAFSVPSLSRMARQRSEVGVMARSMLARRARALRSYVFHSRRYGRSPVDRRAEGHGVGATAADTRTGGDP